MLAYLEAENMDLLVNKGIPSLLYGKGDVTPTRLIALGQCLGPFLLFSFIFN